MSLYAPVGGEENGRPVLLPTKRVFCKPCAAAGSLDTGKGRERSTQGVGPRNTTLDEYIFLDSVFWAFDQTPRCEMFNF